MQVDSLMPYILTVLRETIGDAADNIRLGNVRCVSAKRGWWTSSIKQQIWERGGAGWMVGKINVGKSNLFECIFPKGRTKCLKSDTLRRATSDEDKVETQMPPAATSVDSLTVIPQNKFLNTGRTRQESFLSSPTVETAFPILPLVSSLPGTTVRPIRLSFGNGKGELIDLPGLDRGHLETYVQDHLKDELVMQHRPKPYQLSIKPGQSLLVGGLVRITPLSNDLNFLAFPFVPLKCHVASTDHIISKHTQDSSSAAHSIVKPGVGHRMFSAGQFALRWDVTKQRAGPLTRKDAVGLTSATLPFAVFSADVLIEGCGWIELVAQVRKKDLECLSSPTASILDDKPYPRFEVVRLIKVPKSAKTKFERAEKRQNVKYITVCFS
ncbi:uncharacterized protein KY384_004451 [Bacidia gigantensis]|uniref:uncharacterized protein n=1 Tax=Bacidia gigantensis TaxID=2732470 RepID=UPI001D05BBAA|nr:uncharacterized protein KY384_004451 [Bacidia gigantensis]KAG8531094.1 hypothetical protein KY384_004451 [Bacidia gigantensis]